MYQRNTDKQGEEFFRTNGLQNICHLKNSLLLIEFHNRLFITILRIKHCKLFINTLLLFRLFFKAYSSISRLNNNNRMNTMLIILKLNYF